MQLKLWTQVALSRQGEVDTYFRVSYFQNLYYYTTRKNICQTLFNNNPAADTSPNT